MSGICGFVGPAPSGVIELMLQAIPYRGDTNDIDSNSERGLGYRFWAGRTAKSQEIFRTPALVSACAGTFAPAVPCPAKHLTTMMSGTTDTVDGAFCGAVWENDSKTLKLFRDPFGIRSIHWMMHEGVFYFASELKQLLAVSGFVAQPDYLALHKYLTFSFVPGEDSAVVGIKRIAPGSITTFTNGELSVARYFNLQESIDPEFSDQSTAVRFVKSLCKNAVEKRLTGDAEVGLYLSGGIDSFGIAVWLRELGVRVRAFTLDFGHRSIELTQAKEVAKLLDIPLTVVSIQPMMLEQNLEDIVWKLDRPLGDGVTGPQYLLGRAAREAGLSVVFNGEGGDQFFGGWSNKPMISAALYADEDDDHSLEEMYLRTYHKFYGLEEQLYSEAFLERVNTPGVRRSHLQSYFSGNDGNSFLSKLRFADIHLKASQNILPRMERMTNCWGLDARAPLFDRSLAEGSFRIPPQMKLHGACEKYVIKLALQRDLPQEIVWRRKFGMSVPVTDWVLDSLAPLISEVLGERSIRARGLFSPTYVARLRNGINEAQEVRRRRIGERLWTLLMLEMWMRRFIDSPTVNGPGVES
jgi:asparagine synthase (glutamine-hydrolysing)